MRLFASENSPAPQQRAHRGCRVPAHRRVRMFFPVIALAGLTLFGQTSCLTTREAKGNVRTKIGFDNEFLKSRNVDADDSDQIRKKFADSGWKTNEEGEMVPRNQDLYRGKKFGRGKDFEKKDARLAKRETEQKYFKTPEYLERQEFATKSAREGSNNAREGLFEKNRADESGRSANTDAKDGFLAGLNPFKTSSARESGESFNTSTNRQISRAQQNAAYPRGTSQAEMGFYTDSVNTLDDVKKLLNPEAFD